MLDLNDLRVFERVASLRSFSQAARGLSMPRSSVSRSIAKLEATLGTRLLQRSTREVSLTPTGLQLLARCAEVMERIERAIEEVGCMTGAPRGTIKVSAGVGFGINVLGTILPEFLARYPDVDIVLDLSSEFSDLVAERVDVALRLGKLADSQLIAVRLGSMSRFLCASPAYLARKGLPQTPESLCSHDWIALYGTGGSVRPILLSRGDEEIKVEPRMRVGTNEALTQFNLVRGGAGLAVCSGYLVAPEFERGSLVHILPDWTPPPLDVSMIFPTKKEMAPAVRAFVDFMSEVTSPSVFWRQGPESPSMP